MFERFCSYTHARGQRKKNKKKEIERETIDNVFERMNDQCNSATKSIFKKICWGLGHTPSRKCLPNTQFFTLFLMMSFLLHLHEIKNFEGV